MAKYISETMVPQNGIETIIITGRVSEIVNNRAKEMDITEVYQNIQNKEEKVKELLKKKKIKKQEAAYIGDDENDIEAMKLCQYKACPKNATKRIKEISNYICEFDGGLGAVREFCEYILSSVKNQ